MYVVEAGGEAKTACSCKVVMMLLVNKDLSKVNERS
jgi:hypothetical protein